MAIRALFVSPHSDDVCLSIGGIASTVTVPKHLVTVFSVSRWTHPDWGRPPGRTVPSIRDEEDRAFCSSLGFTFHSLGLPDSSVRHQGRVGDLRLRSGHERSLSAELEKRLVALLEEHRIDVVFSPIGIGGHTDHLVAASVTRRATSQMGIACFLYEDLPYASSATAREIARAVRRVDRKARAITCRTSIRVVQKLQMLGLYQSQRCPEMLESIPAYNRRLSGERGSGVHLDDCSSDRVIERLWSSADSALLMELSTAPLELDLGRAGLLAKWQDLA